jgi:hypothetical protein
MGSAFLPGHPAWATLLIWASAVLGSVIAHWVSKRTMSAVIQPAMPINVQNMLIFLTPRSQLPYDQSCEASPLPSPLPASPPHPLCLQIYLPRVIGMLVAGMLLENLPGGIIDAFPSKWGMQIRAAALATIFLRCGLELDFGVGLDKYRGARIGVGIAKSGSVHPCRLQHAVLCCPAQCCAQRCCALLGCAQRCFALLGCPALLVQDKVTFPVPFSTMQTMRRYKWPATRLALIPGLVEAVYVAGMGVALFSMPFLLAMTMGFILKAVCVGRGPRRGGSHYEGPPWGEP